MSLFLSQRYFLVDLHFSNHFLFLLLRGCLDISYYVAILIFNHFTTGTQTILGRTIFLSNSLCDEKVLNVSVFVVDVAIRLSGQFNFLLSLGGFLVDL